MNMLYFGNFANGNKSCHQTLSTLSDDSTGMLMKNVLCGTTRSSNSKPEMSGEEISHSRFLFHMKLKNNTGTSMNRSKSKL